MCSAVLIAGRGTAREVRPTPRESAGIYELVHRSDNYRDLADMVHAFVQARSPGAPLLDVACGIGRYLEELRRWYDVEGVDSSPASRSLGLLLRTYRFTAPGSLGLGGACSCGSDIARPARRRSLEGPALSDSQHQGAGTTQGGSNSAPEEDQPRENRHAARTPLGSEGRARTGARSSADAPPPASA